MRLARRTELTRMMLINVLGEAVPGSPDASGAVLRGAGRRGAGAPDVDRPGPSRGRLRDNGLGAEDIAPTKGFAGSGGASRRPILCRPVRPGIRKEVEGLVRAELRRLAREQMMADLRQSLC